jgi:hypothetical protein
MTWEQIRWCLCDKRGKSSVRQRREAKGRYKSELENTTHGGECYIYG